MGAVSDQYYSTSSAATAAAHDAAVSSFFFFPSGRSFKMPKKGSGEMTGDDEADGLREE